MQTLLGRFQLALAWIAKCTMGDLEVHLEMRQPLELKLFFIFLENLVYLIFN